MAKTEAFERFSDAYDEWFVENAERYEAELEVIRSLLPPAGATGMEVGVGSGKFAAPLGIGIGVEPSQEMAAKAAGLGVEVYPGVAEDLPFPDQCFDFVLLVTTICFVDDVLESLEEAHRVLKPGGFIIVGFVDKESELGRSYQERKDSSRFYRDATFYSSEEVLAFLHQAGFRRERVRQALLPGKPPGIIVDGYGTGAFVAIRAVKPSAGAASAP